MIKKDIYEVGYLILPTVSNASVPEVLNGLMGIVSERGGEIISSSSPQLIELAYDMTKVVDNKNLRFSSAYFGWFKFEVSKDKVEEINEELKKQPKVLRFLLIKTVKEDFVLQRGKGARKSSSSDAEKDGAKSESSESQEEKSGKSSE